MENFTYDELFTIQLALQDSRKALVKKLSKEIDDNIKRLIASGLEDDNDNYIKSAEEIAYDQMLDDIAKLNKKITNMMGDL